MFALLRGDRPHRPQCQLLHCPTVRRMLRLRRCRGLAASHRLSLPSIRSRDYRIHLRVRGQDSSEHTEGSPEDSHGSGHSPRQELSLSRLCSYRASGEHRQDNRLCSRLCSRYSRLLSRRDHRPRERTGPALAALWRSTRARSVRCRAVERRQALLRRGHRAVARYHKSAA